MKRKTKEKIKKRILQVFLFVFLIVGTLLLLTSCMSHQEKVEYYKQQGFNKDEAEAIVAQHVLIGMTEKAVELAWGLPHSVNRSVNRLGIFKQWIYQAYGFKRARRAYFMNGRLTSYNY